MDMFVLAALRSGLAHRHTVIQEIHRRGGAFDPPEGTIHPVRHRLEQTGLLASRGIAVDFGRQ
jgi:PadR family transcriptional regulator, regulatory protein PadR